jgi:hypothetical protein
MAGKECQFIALSWLGSSVVWRNPELIIDDAA